MKVDKNMYYFQLMSESELLDYRNELQHALIEVNAYLLEINDICEEDFGPLKNEINEIIYLEIEDIKKRK